MPDGLGTIARRSLAALVARLRRKLPPPDEQALRCRSAAYDRQTTEVMRRLLGPGSTCIDVGAHSGSILREMIAVAPLGGHIAFEPLPALAAHLRKAYPRVRVHEAALGDENTTAEFVHVENDPAYSGLRERLYDRPDPRLGRIAVRVVRLDDVVPPDGRVDFIKLDIEGGEYHALRGAVRTIARCRPVIVFEAGARSTGQYGVAPEAFHAFVTRELGYRLSTMARWLANEPPLAEGAFRDAWERGTDFYFIAYPPESSARTAGVGAPAPS